MSDNAALALAIVLMLALLATAVYLINRILSTGPRSGRDVIVRCAEGHLFTTIWIPGVSFKAIRLGTTRFQYCPVGDHWARVRPVDPTELNRAEREFAARHRDRPVP